jgi:hypothetical protein
MSGSVYGFVIDTFYQQMVFTVGDFYTRQGLLF